MTEEEYNERKKKFESFKDTLPKEPSGDVKKEYCVGCYVKEDWEFIHVELMKDGSLEDNIPTDECECLNDCLQSETRGTYLLTDTEATELKNHPRVKYVHINSSKYPGTYMDNPDDVSDSEPITKTYRYGSTVKHQRDISTSVLPTSSNALPGSSLLNRCGSQLKRLMQKIDPWYGQSDSTIINDRIQQFGTGLDVDIIVCDTDMWFGHIEFQNPNSISNIKQSNNSTAASTSGPTNYVGTNVLKSGYASYSTTGSCELLDLVLDAPYYLDPNWFEENGSPSNPNSRLTTRWDGTVVPKEADARLWWTDSSKRSTSFASAGTIDSSSISAYTRDRCNGSNTAYQTGSNSHGTPCASQAYGRQFGWAYNANKWFLNLYGSYSIGWKNGFDMQKIFHQVKPVNSTYGTQDPTISSNSWSHRQAPPTSGYYYFREGVSGGTGSNFSNVSERPAFMNYFTGDGYNRRGPEYVDGHAAITAGDELIESGVIFVCASGNENQKRVQSNHPDYNNYFASSANTNYADAKTNSIYSSMNNAPTYNSLNRPGYPQQLGVDRTTTPYEYKTIAIGVLDEEHDSLGKERKANYSNMGNTIDCFSVGKGTLAACDNNDSPRYNRYDAYYTYDSNNSVESEIAVFGGTSSACPICVGLIAAKLQYNRNWTYKDVKNWLKSGIDDTTTDYLYSGTEATTANDTSNWGDYYNLQGADLRIIYDAPTGVFSIAGTGLSFSGDLIIT